MKHIEVCLKVVRLSVESVQIIKMSSMYQVMSSGCICCVCMKSLSIVDMKMLAMVDENVAPMAVPLICWNVKSICWNVKSLKVKQLLMLTYSS